MSAKIKIKKEKKCVSPCKGTLLEKCKPPFCNYINKTRKYCTLNRKRYLLKKDERGCNIYPKAEKGKKGKKEGISTFIKAKLIEKSKQAKERVVIKQKTKKLKKKKKLIIKKLLLSKSIAAKLILKSKQAKERVLTKKLDLIRKKQAERTIKKFMLNPKVREKSTAHFLNSICSDSGVCIAFGQEAGKIKKFFNQFTDFTYLNGNIKRIGKLSANGFLYELEYVRQGYKAYAVLKSTMAKDNDNLMYEYFVGNAVNTFAKQVPCFVETYGLFEYPDQATWLKLKKNTPDKEDVVKNQLILQVATTFNDLGSGCSKAKYQCVLIQHLKDSLELGTWVRQNKGDFANKEMMSIFYILYFSLRLLVGRFTHYDLHAGNVLLYRPSETGYINYVFHENKKVVKFKCRFIPKIIDYGRSFYSLSASDNSDKLYQKLCTLPACEPNCGYDQGFNWLNSGAYYIKSRQNHVSHDLRILDAFKPDIKKAAYKASKDIKDFFNKVVYDNTFGTDELINSGLPGKINNVYDAFRALSKMISAEQPALSDGVFSLPKYNSLGELHVYSDGRAMRFIKNL
jgi:hypothetical protein